MALVFSPDPRDSPETGVNTPCKQPSVGASASPRVSFRAALGSASWQEAPRAPRCRTSAVRAAGAGTKATHGATGK